MAPHREALKSPSIGSSDEDTASVTGEDTDSENDRILVSGMPNSAFLPSTQDNKRCIYLRQGDGGIFTLPTEAMNPLTGEIHKATTICTTGCSTCVGVYIPIDTKRCFAAHFDGCLFLPGKDRNVDAWQVPDHLVDSLKSAVRSALDHSFKGMEGEVKSIRESEELKERVIIICPWQVVAGERATGFHIIDVLCDYFQLDKAKLSTNSSHHGFIVDHFGESPAQPTLLGWGRPAPTERDLDQIAKLADGCDKPTWVENARAVFRATWKYVMHFDLGWETLLPKGHGQAKWVFEHDKDGWHWGGVKTFTLPQPRDPSS